MKKPTSVVTKNLFAISAATLLVALISQTGINFLGQVVQSNSLRDAYVGKDAIAFELLQPDKVCMFVQLNGEQVSDSIVCKNDDALYIVSLDVLKQQPIQGDTLALCTKTHCTNTVQADVYYDSVQECFALAHHEFYMQSAHVYEAYYAKIVDVRENIYARGKKEMLLIEDKAARTEFNTKLIQTLNGEIATYKKDKVQPVLHQLKERVSSRLKDCKKKPTKKLPNGVKEPDPVSPSDPISTTKPTNAINPTKVDNPTNPSDPKKPRDPTDAINPTKVDNPTDATNPLPPPQPPAAGFPKDRSLNRRRIGLTSAALQKMHAANARNPSTSRTAAFIKSFEAIKPDMDAHSKNPALDFITAGDYRLCTQVVTSMGLLGALGDQEALATAKGMLLRMAQPFSQSNVTISNAQAIWDNTANPRDQRMKAFNVLKEANINLWQGAGDPIYLQSGAYGNCLGIGYDWLYAELTSAERQTVEVALKELLLWSINIHDHFFVSNNAVVQKESNWNPVINGGAGIAALAALENETAFSCPSVLQNSGTAVVRRARSLDALAKQQVCLTNRALEHYWKAYTSAGVYKEGPAYFHYGLQSYQLYTDTLATMLNDTSLWSRFSVIQKKATYLQMLQTTPVNYQNSASFYELYGYADASGGKYGLPASYTFLSIAKAADSNYMKNHARWILDEQLLDETRGRSWKIFGPDWTRVFSVLLDSEGKTNPLMEVPLAIYTTSDHKLDMAHLSVNSPNGKWVINQKGGDAQNTSHSHLDSSSFDLNIGSFSWFRDLGGETRNGYPSNYWQFPTPDSPTALTYEQALSYFRKNDLSHNVVSLPLRPFNPAGSAKIVDHSEAVDASGSVVRSVSWDTSTLYAPTVTSSNRKMVLTERGRYTTADIIDELYLNGPINQSTKYATWHVTHCPAQYNGWTNDQRVETINGISTAILSMTSPSGTTETLHLMAIRPKNATISITTANPNTNQAIKKTPTAVTEYPNTGCVLISINAEGKDVLNQGNDAHLARFVVRAVQPIAATNAVTRLNTTSASLIDTVPTKNTVTLDSSNTMRAAAPSASHDFNPVQWSINQLHFLIANTLTKTFYEYLF